MSNSKHYGIRNEEIIYNNYINGNLSDFRKQIKSLNKIKIFRFLRWLQSNTSNTSEIICYLARLDTLNY